MRRRFRTLWWLLLLLAAIGLFLLRPRSGDPSSKATHAASVSRLTPRPIAASQAARVATTRTPPRINSKGKVRLKPGESAVLGYWEIAPGMNGMAIVTPETTPEGQVKMTARLLHLSDAAVSDAQAKDLLPALFDFENCSAIGPERLRELQSSLQNTHGVDLLSTPAVLTLPGQQAHIAIGNSNDTMLSLGLQADPVAADGGYDLRLDLQLQE